MKSDAETRAELIHPALKSGRSDELCNLLECSNDSVYSALKASRERQQAVTDCHPLKITVAEGKQQLIGQLYSEAPAR